MDKSKERKYEADPELTVFESSLSTHKKIQDILKKLKDSKTFIEKRDKGEKGDSPVKGVDYWTETEIKELENKIKYDITPVKGQDYFTDSEIKTIIEYVLRAATPVKGRDYVDGEKGERGESIKGDRGERGFPGEIGKSGRDGKDAVLPDLKEVIKEVFKDPKFQIEKRSIKNFDMSDQRWHGSGSSTGGGGTPGGSTTQVQYNNNGAFGGMKIDYTEVSPTSLRLKVEDGSSPISGTNLTILGASGSGASTGGGFVLSGGTGGSTGDGGGLTIQGGRAGNSGGNGGDIVLEPGQSPSGNAGFIRLLDPVTENAAILNTSVLSGDQVYVFPDSTGYFSIVTSGVGAPASTPSALGQIYIATGTSKVYCSTGTTNSGDWRILN